MLFRSKAEISKPLDQKKISLNWEGPYRISETLRSDAYRLETLEGLMIFQTWNADNLKMYYQ